MRRRSLACLLVALVALCAAGAFLVVQERRPPDVVLVSIDTLRPDRLGCYGHRPDVSPAIDALAARSVVFEDAIAHAPSTLPSHASILTSLLPFHHGASIARQRAVGPGPTTLAEVLATAGYRTASVNGGVQLDRVYGLGRGFEVYEDARPGDAEASALVGELDRFGHAVDRALTWLDGIGRNQPTFLFLHTYEVHHPYTPDPATLARLDGDYVGPVGDAVSIEFLHRVNRGEVVLSAADLERVRRTYDAEIAAVDAALARFLDGLAARGRLEDALIVLTSDHGEEFGEHGLVGWHSHTLHDELLRVPLVVRLPGAARGGERIAGVVRGIDIGPTILAALDRPIPAAFQGVDALSGRPSGPRYAVSSQDVPAGAQVLSIRSDRWKWYQGKLYDLEADPGETTDVAALHPDVVETHLRALGRLLSALPAASGEGVAPDASLDARLRALGYGG